MDLDELDPKKTYQVVQHRGDPVEERVLTGRVRSFYDVDGVKRYEIGRWTREVEYDDDGEVRSERILATDGTVGILPEQVVSIRESE